MKNKDIPPGERGPAALPLQIKSSRSHRILVVDDESTIRTLMTAVLAASGYHVESAEDGAAAWAALQAGSYDLLITDNNMPKISGVELVKNLRSARMALPVVMVAGVLPEEELAQDPSLQLAAKLSKPFDLADFLNTVTDVLHVAE
jgi:CheY-like chemotaxis protein